MTKANKKLTDNGNKLVSQTSLQLLPLIMQNIPQAVFWKDQNLVYLGCNRAFAEDAGFASPEDVIGKTDFDMPWKDQAEAYRADDQRVLDGGEPKLNYEEPQTTPNGSTIWLRTSKIPVCEDGRVVAILGMYEDITEHKQAELDLLLRDRALASSINAIVIISLLDNKPIYVNESLLRITGYTHEEALQLTLLDILDNPEETDKYIRSTQAQGFFIGEELIKRKDGSFFPASFSSSVITDAKGKPIAVQSSFFDITDRKQAETLQQQSERLFRALFEMSPDAVTLIDPYDPSGEWPIVDCNAATCHINGYTREELIGQPINIVNAPTNTPIDRVDYLKRLEEGQSIKYEIFHRRKNGEIFPVEVSTTMIKVGDRELLLGIDRDITERKQTEEALQENRSLYQSLVETSPLSICRKDLAGRFTFANQRFLKLSHTTLDELVGKTDFDLHPSELAEKYRSDDLAVMESGQVEEIIEERAVHEGETALVQTIKAPIYDGTGKVNGIQISFWDITDRKRAEATIRDSEERLRAIYEGTHDAVMILNEKGFFDCNSQTLKMFGYKTKEEFTSIHPADVSPASQPDGRDSMSASQEHIQTAYRQGYDRFEWVHRRNSGEDFPAEVLLSAFDLGGQRVLQATVREITERRQAEKAIQENEERFRRFTEATSEALIFHEQGKIVDVNPAALAMFGFAKEADVIGTNLLEFVAPESRALVMEKMQLGDVPPYEAICIRTDKTTFPIETRTRSYKFGDSIIRATSVRDITQRKKAEAQVQQEKSFSDAIINGLPGTFYLFDLQGKMVRWNKEYEKVSGYSAEEIPTMSVVDTLAEEDREAALTTIQRAMVEGQGAVEAKFICKDGRTIPYYFAGQRLQIGDQVYMAGTGMDLTERKKADAALRESEQKFRNLADNFAVGLFIHQKGIIRYMGREAARLLGHEIEEMLGRPIMDFVHPEERQRVAEIARQRPAGAEVPDQYETRLLKKDGSALNVLMYSTLVEYEGDVATQGAFLDITERKQAEAQLQQEKFLSDAIINGLPGTFYLFDTQGKLIRWNKQYEQVLGYTTEETAARNAIDPIAEEDRENTTAAIQQTFVEGQGSVEASFVTKDGRRIPYYFVGQRIQLGDQLYLAGTGIDITERRKLEEQIQTALERRGLQVQLSTQVSQSIAAAASLEELYERVVTQVKEQFGYYHAQLLRYDEAQDAVTLVIGYGETGAKMLAAGHRMPMGEGLIGTAASTGETILRPDLANDPDWHPNPLLPETKGEIAVPIKLGNEILGVLDVQSSAAGALGADDQLLLEGLCGQIATAIESTRLRQEMTKQAERDILLRERALDSSINAVFITDRNGKVMYTNDAFLKLSGYTHEEAMQLPTEAITSNPETAQRIGTAIQTQGFYVGEDIFKRKDGSTFPIDYFVSSIKDAEGNPIATQASFVDITERKQAEAQLQQEKSFSDTIINGLPGTFYLFDLQGKMIRWNRQYEIVSGYTAEEIPLLSVDASVAQEDRERVAATIQRAFMEGQATVEANIINRDGRRTPYYLTGQRLQIGDQIYLVGTGVDITERKQAERALRESQQFLQTIMDNIPQSIFWKDNNLIYLGCNSAFAADTGLTTPGDVVGKTDWDMPWKDQAEAYRADDGLVIKNGTPKLNYEEPQTTPEGRTSWLRTSKIPLYDIDGNAFAVLGMYEDITERKQAEENVRTSREQLLNIIDFLPDATLVTDKDRKVVAWNRALEEMTGIKSEEIVGKGDYAYAVPFYGDARPMLVDFAMEHTQVADRYEGIQQQGDRLSAEIYVSSVYQGRGGYLLAIASPLYDANGNIIGAIEAIRDVTERKELELQVQEAFERRGLQVQLSTQISQSIASAASLEDLYERVVTQVKDQFGYYHTQLLRYDEAQEAVVLITGYGETGAKMLAAGHRMPMGEGLIGTAASTGETILRPDLANDPDWHPNPLLPETKGEIAVPIKLGNDILGVLDVQSSAAGALGADDQLLLEGLCGQIATAIESTRLRQEMAERLEEVNRLYRAMSHEGWQTYRETTDIPSSFVYDQAGLRPAKDIDLAEELFANVPLAIPGGEVIGTLAVADDPQRPITPEDETFLQQVSEQLALALESARLFEQTQTALVSVRESQAALDEAMNVANMTNWEYDLATHELTVGERLFTMLGTTVEEFRDSELTATQYIQKFEHPEDRGVVERSLQDAAQSLDPKNFLGHVEFRIVHKDGQTRYMSSSYRVRTDEQGTPLTAIGSWLDITERKKAELAIQESRAALEEAMTVAGMANWELSFETLKFTFNDRIFQMLGTTAEEDGYEIPAEEYAKKYIHPEDAPLIFGAIQEGIQSPDPQNFKGSLEYRMIRKDGAIRYMLTDYRLVVNKQGQAIGGVGSFLDITERKLAELAVAKRAAELATVAQVGTTTAATLEPDRLLQSVVDLAKEQFGLYHAHIYTYEESWSTLLLAAGAGEVGRKLVAEEHAIPMSLEQSLVARAAREQKAVIVNDVNSEPGFLPNPLLPETCAEMAVPMTVGDRLLGVFDVQSNNPTGFSQEDANIYVTLASQVAVALQNARMYVEQAALVTQLRELDRLKSSFLANMSHELRTPLNSILGFADVIIEGLDGPLTENMSNDLRLIQKNGQHLLHLINDVLDMSKIEAGRMNLSPENFKVVEVLEEVTSITSTLASEKNLALFIDEDSDPEIGIYADRTRLRQVMINLVNNSIKFTENGKISLKVASLEGARILITVKDTGIGIPPDKLEVIFQEFTQVDSSTTRKVGGTGLGLPISRRLIEMHGGRVWAESTGVNGEGSTFFVEMPIEARITEVIEKQAK